MTGDDNKMTEHSRIPLPGQTLPGQTGDDRAKSLIERASLGFDLKRQFAPPVPPLGSGLGGGPGGLAGRRPPMAPPKAPPSAAVPIVMPKAPPVMAKPLVAPQERADSAPQPSLPPHAQPARPAARRPQTIYPIDRERLRDFGMIVPEGPITGLLEEYRIVKRQLLMTAAESRDGIGADHGERILICSAHPNEGKTYSAINLALSIAAEKDHEVLLVDADFAKPSILSTLGLPGQTGLMDALADPGIHVEDLIIGTDVPGLSILAAGGTTNADTEYLASSRTRDVLDRLTRDNPTRIVIFDSPPALAASPASELATHCGQALLIVRADRTSETALRDAISILSGCENIQLLLNCVKFSPTGRRFGSYYGYGE